MAGWLPRPGIAVICANGWFSGQRPVKKPSRSISCSGKSSADSPSGERRSAAAVTWSVPGARPMPRSIRPGWSASSMPNCSATTSETWLGSITPPEPTRMVVVASAMWPISTGGAELAMPGMLWCSATQNRRYPSRSACWARSIVARRASPAVPPSGTGARSSTDRGTARGPKVRGESSTTGPNSAKRLVLPCRRGDAGGMRRSGAPRFPRARVVRRSRADRGWWRFAGGPSVWCSTVRAQRVPVRVEHLGAGSSPGWPGARRRAARPSPSSRGGVHGVGDTRSSTTSATLSWPAPHAEVLVRFGARRR